MAEHLVDHSYGKDGIRVVTRGRDGEAVAVRDLTLDVRLWGAFGPSFTAGDNSATLPTDSLRNHAYAVAHDLPAAEPECYAEEWLTRLLAAVPAADRAESAITIHPWRPMTASVLAPASWAGRATVACERGGPVTITGGLSQLTLLAPYSGGFSGFLRDDLTDQQESTDRVMAGQCQATWRYRSRDVQYSDIRERVRGAMTAAFGMASSGVQGTVYAMAHAALAAAPELSQITVRVVSIPHSPTAGRPPAQADAGAVWSAATEPAGVTEATLRHSQ